MCVLFLISAGLIPGACGVNYEVVLDDPAGDVMTFDDSGKMTAVSGHENIDILKISSAEMALKQNLMIEMTVAGVITDSDNHSYSFNIMDGEDIVYMIFYTNGLCSGMSMTDYETEQGQDVLITTGAGTDTLKVTMPVKNLKSISDFDLTGSTSEFAGEADDFLMLLDLAPDDSFQWDDGYDDWTEKDIIILKPVDGSTVFGEIVVSGISNTDDHEFRAVEVQLDQVSQAGWREADTDDDWQTWSYDLDTASLSGGRHTVHARAYDGEEYFNDTITIYVDQSQAVSPDTMPDPKLHKGDRFTYKLVSTAGQQDIYGDLAMSGSMTMTVDSVDTVSAGQTEYEVYIIDMTGNQKLESTEFSYETEIEGTRYLRTSDLALVKEDTRSEIKGGFLFGEDEVSQEELTYEPPLEQYRFPLKIGEYWGSTSEVTTISTYSYDGETESDTYTESRTTKYQCLRTETTVVPAGSFETFLLFYFDDYTDYIDKDGGYVDSNGDGWTDEDELLFETDPQDPEDYPFKEFEDENGTTGNSAGSDGDFYYGSSWDDTEDNYLYSGYTVEYLSPKLGLPVKIEYYDQNRVLVFSMELDSYKAASKDNTGAGSQTFFDPASFDATGILAIAAVAVLVVLLLIAAVLIKRRKKSGEVQDDMNFAAEPQVIAYTPAGYQQARINQPPPATNQRVGANMQYNQTAPKRPDNNIK